MFRALDVLEIHKPQDVCTYANSLKQNNYPDAERYQEHSRGFRSCTQRTTALSDVYPCGEYGFYLGIYAENAKPLFVKLSFNYEDEGFWNDNTEVMRKRLKIKVESSNKRKDIFN